LDQSSDTILHLNKGALHHPADQIQADQLSVGSITFDAHATAPGGIPVNGVVGSRNPVVIAGGELPRSARAHLAGRENIMMTEWGPWDHESPLLQFVQHVDHGDEFRLLCSKTRPLAEQIQIEGEAVVEVQDDRIRVLPKAQNVLTPYRIAFEVEDHKINATGLLTGGTWNIKTFPSIVDPRENADQWRASGLANSRELSADHLELRCGHGSISDALQLPVTLPSDHFGTIATRSLTFPSGRWRIKTTSDDGIRVWLDDKLIIDDWTWHAPKDHTYEFDVEQPRELNLRVEHFELDGNAVLSVQIESAN
jgi:hypothetical protein